MNSKFSQYTIDYISGVMSLRKPQIRSLEKLKAIVTSVNLSKNIYLREAMEMVHAMYPTCTDFERDFLSVTFALATGVGKTRLMGAFIAYLYTQYDIKNYFIVAPNMTIYEKLRRELSDWNHPKYVFRGLGCFSPLPQVIADESYREKSILPSAENVRLFVFNIDKFNKESSNMKRVNEMLGDSFYEYLAGLPDLVMIMDESHHYRGKKGAKALDELHPLLGLELTATPLVNKGARQIPFKNVVYEYPLSKAVADGYTRTPFAVTRSDVDFYNFGEDPLDKLMLLDGVACHENAKMKLMQYANNHGLKVVKPFMLVVCKDTEHAEKVQRFVCSNEFRDGHYKNKTIIIHSKQKGVESEANTRLLLDVENTENPIEIVIHVNMLKEGWDVNNLYTIVPLRTAASQILREQMVGRGLRLPYGERTGDRDVDAVMLTAHDKFDEIVAEAQKGDSIFKAGNVIHVEDLGKEQIHYSQLCIDLKTSSILREAYKVMGVTESSEMDSFIRQTDELIKKTVTKKIQEEKTVAFDAAIENEIAEEIEETIAEDKDLGRLFYENKVPILAWAKFQTKEIHRAAANKFIPIPQIKVTDAGVEEYEFVDFDLSLDEFTHVPIKNEVLIQNLEDMRDRKRMSGSSIDFDAYNHKKVILEEIRKKPEIDYEKCSELLIKLITQMCEHYEKPYGLNGMRNIIMMYKKDIADLIYNQMMMHFYFKNGFLKEEVIGSRDCNLQPMYSYKERVNLYDDFTENIQSVLFDGIERGVFREAKFDSLPELQLARNLEREMPYVQNWLRPAPDEFNLTYNRGHRYEPDFVVETEGVIFLVEVKGENLLKDATTIAKKERGIQYCQAASRWGKANAYKEWQYLFIPSKQVTASVSFENLAERFREK